MPGISVAIPEDRWASGGSESSHQVAATEMPFRRTPHFRPPCLASSRSHFCCECLRTTIFPAIGLFRQRMCSMSWTPLNTHCGSTISCANGSSRRVRCETGKCNCWRSTKSYEIWIRSRLTCPRLAARSNHRPLRRVPTAAGFRSWWRVVVSSFDRLCATQSLKPRRLSNWPKTWRRSRTSPNPGCPAWPTY